VNQITAMVAALTPQARQSLRRELDRQDPPAGTGGPMTVIHASHTKAGPWVLAR